MMVLATNKKHFMGASSVCQRSKGRTILLTTLTCPLHSLCWRPGVSCLTHSQVYSEAGREAGQTSPFIFLSGKGLLMDAQRHLDPVAEACYMIKYLSQGGRGL